MDVNKLLSYEYFGLLTDDERSGVNALRDANKLPPAIDSSSNPEENLNAFKEMLQMSPIGQINLDISDEEYADLFASGQVLEKWFQEPENKAMLGATVGGIIVPSAIPGVGPATLPARYAAIASQYPRLAKIIGAFIGGFSGSAPFVDAESPQEVVQQAGKYGLIEAGGETFIQTIAKFFPLFKDGIKRLVTKDAEKGAKEAVEQGVMLTPGQMTSSRVVDTLENMASNAWWGGGQMAKAKQVATETASENIGDMLLKKFHPKVGKVFDDSVQEFLANTGGKNFADIMQSFLKNGRAAQDVFIDQSYKNLDKAITGITGNAKIVDISGLKKYVANLQKEVPTDSTLAAVYKQIQQLDDLVDFTFAKNLRSMFLGNTKAFQETGIPTTTFSNKVSGAAFAKVNEQMENAVKTIAKEHEKKLIAEGMDPKLAKEAGNKLFSQINGAFRGAQDFYSLSKDTFNSLMVSKMIKAKPDAVYNMLMKSKSPDLIKQFNNLLEQGVKDGAISKAEKLSLTKDVQGEFFAKIITDSIDQKTGIVNATSLFEKMRSFGGTANRALVELFDSNPELLKEFRTLTRTLQLAQEKGIQGAPGGFLVQLLAAGGIGAAVNLEVGWEDAATFGIVFGGPKLIAKTFTDPAFIKSIFQINKLKPGSDMYTRAVVQTLNDFLTKDYVGKQNVEDFVNEGVSKGYLNEDALKFLEKSNVKQGGSNKSNYKPSKDELEAKSNILQQLNIDTLDTEPVVETKIASTKPSAPPSMLGLGLPTLGSETTSQSVNPNTIASLESVGLPFFANEGGLATIQPKKFKKPQVVS